MLEADQKIEQRGLAAAGLADDGNEFAGLDPQRQLIDGDDRLSRRRLAKHLAQLCNVDRSRCGHARHLSKRLSSLTIRPSSRNSNTTSTSVQANTSATENSSCANASWWPMPVTAPTSSAMVTTRIARLSVIFQLVMMPGRIAGSISLLKNCSRVGLNERIICFRSCETSRMLSSASTVKTGAQTTTSTNTMRNSTPLNHSTANRIQDTTGTAIRMRTIGRR